ncbi:BZ3500_MvSof-1268-A1-R1_Chr12-3g04047 [Microbotryum saponariae]|uniref:BZ3500_MvSof-1268-A1-R1_Chr12-3g04047 protein n=1 Tax=Microbotryum saponariae TaxID=289078 RepID=A0A2X0KM09_9BASI|nr:BZ3500_MvSof-1268-A1-R1_Chr12-3g04047 [Microbotryum saponariae]
MAASADALTRLVLRPPGGGGGGGDDVIAPQAGTGLLGKTATLDVCAYDQHRHGIWRLPACWISTCILPQLTYTPTLFLCHGVSSVPHRSSTTLKGLAAKLAASGSGTTGGAAPPSAQYGAPQQHNNRLPRMVHLREVERRLMDHSRNRRVIRMLLLRVRHLQVGIDLRVTALLLHRDNTVSPSKDSTANLNRVNMASSSNMVSPSKQPQYGQPPQGYGQQPQYGQPHQQQEQQQQQQQHHGGAAPGGGPDANAILATLRQCVVDQKITAFYPPGSLEPIAAKIAQSGALPRLASEWNIPMEVAIDTAKLALFDTVLYCDDSGSMAFEEGGTRIDDLKVVISRCAYATSLFDFDGIQVRFMKSVLRSWHDRSRVEGNGINSESGAMQLIENVKFSGLTPLGQALDEKVLQPLVLGPARAGRLQKPVVVIAVTDGIPSEPRDNITRVIINANRELARTRYGPDAISYQFAQVGNDQKARAFLEELDKHPEIGDLIDTTSNYENEADDFARNNAGVELTPSLWLVKLLLGPIDSSYDTKDE